MTEAVPGERAATCRSDRASAVRLDTAAHPTPRRKRFSPTITLSTYAHLMPEAQRDAVDHLDERLERLGREPGFDAGRQPNGNRAVLDVRKSLAK
jgi:hypothetical protein